MHAECEKIAQRCAADNADHLAFLLQLCELELIERERKAAERRLKPPGSRPTSCWMSSTSRPGPASTSRCCLRAGQRRVSRQAGEHPARRSQRHRQVAPGHGAGDGRLRPGRKVRFFRVTELITLLLEAKEERQLLRMRQQLGKLDLLILDELGYVPASKAGAELLFDVIATAYERNSLIVTTNLPFENWTEVLGSERLTGAALDRLTHRCHILETKGESYRLQDAKRRRRRIPRPKHYPRSRHPVP